MSDDHDLVAPQQSSLSDILEAGSIVVYTLDSSWRVTYFNQGAGAQKGGPDPVGQELWEVHPELKDSPFERECRRVQKENVQSVFRVHSSPLFGKRDATVSVFPYRGGIALLLSETHEQEQRKELDSESGDHYRLITDSLPVLISYIDLEYRYRLVNETYQRWFGKRREEVLGRTMQEVLGEEAWAVIKPKVEQALAGESVSYEAQLSYRDGGQRSIHASYTPDFDSQGTVRGVAILVQDVTERRRVEQLARESEDEMRETARRLNLAVEIAQIGIFEIDLETDSVTVNEAGRLIYGWNSCQQTFSNVQTHFHLEDKDYVLRQVQDSLNPEGNRRFEVEQRIIRRDGEERWIKVQGITIFSGFPDSLKPSRMVGVYIDITDRKHHEAILLRKNRSLQLLAETATMLLSEPEPEELVRAALASAATLFSFPVHVCFLLNKQSESLKLVVAEGLNDRAREELSRLSYSSIALEAQEPEGREHLPDEDSTSKISSILRSSSISSYVAQPMIASDEVIGVLFVGTKDRTKFSPGARALLKALAHQIAAAFERNRVVRELKASEEYLREQDKRKDQFIAMLAHELRNPLGPIRSAVHILGRRQDETTLTRVREIISRQVEHLAHIVTDLLEVYRLNEGKVTLREEVLDLSSIVQNIVEDERPALEKLGLNLSTNYTAEPVSVSGDRTRLTQAIHNLLVNASKFTKKGGQIRIEVTRNGESALITVEDNGIGMSPHLIERLFEPFSQGDESLDRSRGGLGLGLALVKGLVELHRGSITAESAGAGQGSKFTIYLPLEKGSPKDDHITKPAEVAAGIKVLIVEDNEDAAQVLRLVLELNGCDVLVAHSGEQGVQAALEFRPHIVLSDIGLPGLDGYEVARQLHEKLSKDVPLLIALTGYGENKDQKKALQAGFSLHFTKPVDPLLIENVLANYAKTR